MLVNIVRGVALISADQTMSEPKWYKKVSYRIAIVAVLVILCFLVLNFCESQMVGNTLERATHSSHRATLAYQYLHLLDQNVDASELKKVNSEIARIHDHLRATAPLAIGNSLNSYDISDAVAKWNSHNNDARSIEQFVQLVDRQTAKENRFGATASHTIHLIGAGILIIASVVIAFLLRKILLRIRELVAVANRFQKGESVETSQLIGHDEFSEVGSAFNDLIEQLKAAVERSDLEKARLKATLDATADGIIAIDSEGTIRSFNKAAEHIFAYQAEQAIGTNVSTMVPALYQKDAQYENRNLELGESILLGPEVEVSGRTEQGKEIPLSMRVSEMNYMGEPIFIATLQDIESRQQIEEQKGKLFNTIRETVNHLATASAQINGSTTEQSAAMHEQGAAVAETLATVTEIAQSSEQAVERADHVVTLAKSSEEVGNSGRESVEQSIRAMNEVRIQVESIADNILRLAERAQLIGEIISTVSDIAEQTNLLALNAAVEAARAGEHGRGFAVVASEIKSLAAESKKATVTVRRILGEIQESTNAAVLSTEHGTKSVATTGKIVTHAGDIIQKLSKILAESLNAARQISATSSQQNAGLQQLNDAMKNIDVITRQNVSAIRQVQTSSDDLHKLSLQLSKLTSDETLSEFPNEKGDE